MVPADLIDRAALGAAATTVLDRWGAVDVVVHNARYIGPGHMDTFLGAPGQRHREPHARQFLRPPGPQQVPRPADDREGERAHHRPDQLVGFQRPGRHRGKGGWGLSYGTSKAAMHRVAGILSQELAPYGILVINIDPGYIATERIAQDMAGFGFAADGEPAEVVGAVVAWLATSEESAAFNGQTIFAQDFCHERGLLPGWPGPKLRVQSSRPDMSGARVAALNAKYAPTS